MEVMLSQDFLHSLRDHQNGIYTKSIRPEWRLWLLTEANGAGVKLICAGLLNKSFSEIMYQGNLAFSSAHNKVVKLPYSPPLFQIYSSSLMELYYKSSSESSIEKFIEETLFDSASFDRSLEKLLNYCRDLPMFNSSFAVLLKILGRNDDYEAFCDKWLYSMRDNIEIMRLYKDFVTNVKNCDLSA